MGGLSIGRFLKSEHLGKGSLQGLNGHKNNAIAREKRGYHHGQENLGILATTIGGATLSKKAKLSRSAQGGYVHIMPTVGETLNTKGYPKLKTSIQCFWQFVRFALGRNFLSRVNTASRRFTFNWRKLTVEDVTRRTPWHLSYLVKLLIRTVSEGLKALMGIIINWGVKDGFLTLCTLVRATPKSFHVYRQPSIGNIKKRVVKYSPLATDLYWETR